MKLGVMWGSGIPHSKVVSWVQRYAATGGWRGRFGTELFDQAKTAGSLAAALRAEKSSWPRTARSRPSSATARTSPPAPCKR